MFLTRPKHLNVRRKPTPFKRSLTVIPPDKTTDINQSDLANPNQAMANEMCIIGCGTHENDGRLRVDYKALTEVIISFFILNLLGKPDKYSSKTRQ